MDPFVGQIIPVAFNFAPVGWQLCDGSLLPISENQALFALLGTTYGGNGTTDFAVPDLRGRAPLDAGTGAGLPNYVQGQNGGAESVVLTANQVGAHSHNLVASMQNGTATNPASNLALAQNPQPTVPVYGAPPSNTPLAGYGDFCQFQRRPAAREPPALAGDQLHPLPFRDFPVAGMRSRAAPA